MFNNTKVVSCLKTLLGWKNHYDLVEIPALNVDLNTTDSGVYYNHLHPAMRLDIISSAIPRNRDLNEYLNEKVEFSINEILGSICSQKEYNKYAKKTLASDVILDGYGWANDVIINNSRFVGFQFKTKLETGLVSVIKKIGIQVTTAQTLKIYLFHSSKSNVITTFDIVISNGLDWNWEEKQLQMNAISETYVGGSWIIGYYQDDLTGQAIDYKKFNWLTGYCASCDGGVLMERWTNLNKYVDIFPIYVPGANLPLDKNKMFDLNDANCIYDTNFGMNFLISVECDLTDFFCEHKFSLTKILGLQVVYSILKDIQFSEQINYIEENLKHMIIRDLEGDKDTNYINIADQLSNEIKAVNFDHSSKSAICLPCDSKRGVTFGVA